MFLRVAAYAVIIDDGQVLLPHWSATGRSGWTLPGGGIDPGEHPEDAAVREVREETGYDVELHGLLGVDSHVVERQDLIGFEDDPDAEPLHGIRVVYRARVVGGSLTVEQDGSTDDVAWHPLDAVAHLPRVDLVDIGLGWAGAL
ncbi:NUDIX hydrolase [Isoptericola sediminis]|uniref:NUDIX hydrolase n=1 Tax=Isoptericola sediminis TaxID=2733572 RepID=A0A849K6Y0_9MICO|nr:NUDIX hydrolase [Isoptericola sediminis]NNU27779.1 NUDIX hydrolase [Isoptericola sediminis]